MNKLKDNKIFKILKNIFNVCLVVFIMLFVLIVLLQRVTDNKISLKEFGVQGKTNIKLTLINNLRNLLGPHHLAEGECYLVTPSSFFKEPCVWKNKNAWGGGASWNDDYCFVEMSI